MRLMAEVDEQLFKLTRRMEKVELILLSTSTIIAIASLPSRPAMVAMTRRLGGHDDRMYRHWWDEQG